MRVILFLLAVNAFAWVPCAVAGDNEGHDSDAESSFSDPQDVPTTSEAVAAQDHGLHGLFSFKREASEMAAKQWLQKKGNKQIDSPPGTKESPTFREVWAEHDNFGPVALALFRSLLMLVPDTVTELFLSSVLLHCAYGALGPFLQTISRLPLAWLPPLDPYNFEAVRINLVLSLLALIRLMQYCTHLARALRVDFLYTPLVGASLHSAVAYLDGKVVTALQELLPKQEAFFLELLKGLTSFILVHVIIICAISSLNSVYASHVARLKAAV